VGIVECGECVPIADPAAMEGVIDLLKMRVSTAPKGVEEER